MRLRDGEICIFTNRRLQLVALAIEFALSNKTKTTVGRKPKKKKKGKNNTKKDREKIQFNFFVLVWFHSDSVLTNVLQLIVS